MVAPVSRVQGGRQGLEPCRARGNVVATGHTAAMPGASFPRELPPLWLLGSLSAMLVAHFVCPIGRWLAPPFTHAGWLILTVGTLLAGLSARRFLRAGTGVRPFTEATALVGGGAYGFTRNPMYVGLVGITVGVAVLLGTIAPAIVPVAFFVLLDRRFVRAEEVFLRQRFGDAYDEYCRRVRRWL